MDLEWLQLVSAPVLILDATTWIVIKTNAACRRSLGLPIDAEGQQPLVEMIGGVAADDVAGFMKTLPLDGSRNALSLLADTASGQKPIVLHFTRMAPGQCFWSLTIDDLAPFFDGSLLDKPENTFRSVIQTLPIGIEIFDHNLHGLFYNAQSDDWFRYGNYADSHIDEWWVPAFPDPAERSRAMAEWDALIVRARAKPGQAQAIEWQVLCRDDVERIIRFQLSMIGRHFTLVYWDVSEQRRLEGSLRTMASTDTLTGLYNRRHFFEYAGAILRQARERARPLALLMVDVDHFKTVNDRFGHRAGDQALVAVAERCRSVLRETDLLARVGGEEFVALLPETQHEDARQIAERINRAVSGNPIDLGTGDLMLTVSIGLSSAGPELTSIDRLIDSADAALYTAKRLGRDRTVAIGDDADETPPA